MTNLNKKQKKKLEIYLGLFKKSLQAIFLVKLTWNTPTAP